jgi:hypothetical protein
LSIADVNRIKRLENQMAEIEARIATLEARLSRPIEVKRPVGRPPKESNWNSKS